MRVWEDKESGVKKRRVSYITGAALIAGLVFLLIGLAILVAIVIVEKVEFYWAVYANFAILIITIIIYIIGMFTSMSAYKFSISYSGITMYEPKHTYEFAWDDFVDYGIAIANVSSPDTQNTFWIYFAKRCLRDIEKCAFMRKLEKKRDYIAYFQYSPEIYEEVRRYIPAQMRSQIDRELTPWIENMTFTEKRLNR